MPHSKRIDEQFRWEPDTALLPELRRLMSVIESRLGPIEAKEPDYDAAITALRDVGLTRIAEVLDPAVERITALSELGFLQATSNTSIIMAENTDRTYIIPEGAQRDYFAPSQFLIVERIANPDDFAVVRNLNWDKEHGELTVRFLTVQGAPGPHADWIISNTSGAAGAVRYYHDQMEAVRNAIVAARDDVAAMHTDVQAAMIAIENGPVASVNGIPGPDVVMDAGHIIVGAGDNTTVRQKLKANSDAVANAATKQYVDTGLNAKADAAATTNALNLKANAQDVTNSLAAKANTTDVNNALASRPTTAEMNTALAAKADAAATNTALASKADAAATSTSLAARPRWDEISPLLDAKANTTNVAADVIASRIWAVALSAV